MVTIIAFCTLYTFGVAGTVWHHSGTLVDIEFENISAGHETSGLMMLSLSALITLSSILWPAYWIGRSFCAVPELMTPEAGEPQ